MDELEAKVTAPIPEAEGQSVANSDLLELAELIEELERRNEFAGVAKK